MYKKAMSCLLLVNLLFLLGFISIWGISENKRRAEGRPVYELKLDETLLADREIHSLGIAAMAASGQRVVGCDVLERKWAYSLSEEDLNVLLRIVEAEAGGEDENGKLLVANVVLNRVNSGVFPDNITDVVFQRSKGVTQFSPVSNGRYYSVKISEETKTAVERALLGEDISQGALYFAARRYADCDRMRWFDEKLTFLFKYGGHEFFK